jgi:hypothetical protein
MNRIKEFFEGDTPFKNYKGMKRRTSIKGELIRKVQFMIEGNDLVRHEEYEEIRNKNSREVVATRH